MLFVIFGIASFLQWSYSHEIKNVSEYHRFMSIPALTALDEIKLDFQMIHMLSIQMIQTDVGNEKYLKLQDGYQKDRVSIEQTLEKYNNLFQYWYIKILYWYIDYIFIINLLIEFQLYHF